LVFDVPLHEEAEVRAMVSDKMRNAMPLKVPIEVEMGSGTDWLEAH
jgi:DNA polymerase-1